MVATLSIGGPSFQEEAVFAAAFRMARLEG